MKRVLIVDDALFMRYSLKSMLEKNNFEVVGEAENGEIGIRKYKELKPDVVTMDITMPEVTGIDAVRAITQYDPQAKVVMVSAMGQESLIREALMNGARYFIVKPFQEEFVVDALNKILSA